MNASTCLHFAVEIERRREPRDWPKALEQVPTECRKECETYLRGIAQRIRVIRGLQNAHSDRNTLV